MHIYIKYVLIVILVAFALLIGSNVWVILSTKDGMFRSIKDVSSSEIALVLGTSRLTTSGEKNPFFEARMDKAAELYASLKIDSVLVSGDNDTQYYNEPRDMSRSLIERGIPQEIILKDAGGLRTFDSFYRFKYVFNKQEAVIITQRFHAYRALYIARDLGINAEVYIADEPPNPAYFVYIREWVARPLALWDLHIANRKPKYTD